MDAMPLCISGNHLGLKRVVFDPERNLRILFNDDTRHGMQSADPARSDEPLAYYHRSGPLGDVFSAWLPPDTGAQLAILGLGVGCIAAYAVPGQHLTFCEIDPGVARIAADPQYFTFLSQCQGTYEIVLGDGREVLGGVLGHRYDIIVLDAFAADRIPPHLICGEALQLYLDKLAPAGILVFHITNVHVELQPPLAGLAAEAGLICLSCADLNVSEDERSSGKLPSHYAVLARSPERISRLVDNPRWTTA
ncbi:MAG: spermidine synthase [Planctomycetota bacterium]|jgi:hypothetical protein